MKATLSNYEALTLGYKELKGAESQETPPRLLSSRASRPSPGPSSYGSSARTATRRSSGNTGGRPSPRITPQASTSEPANHETAPVPTSVQTVGPWLIDGLSL